MNQVLRNKQQRDKRAETNNAATKKYEKTKKGFLMRLYRNMQSRVNGIQKRKQHLYKGKYLLSRSAFYNWAEESLIFHELFDIWEASGYLRKLCPSVDRINPHKGYSLCNIEWVTFSENCKRSHKNRIEYGNRYKVTQAAKHREKSNCL